MSGIWDNFFEFGGGESSGFPFFGFSGKGKNIATPKRAMTIPAFYNAVDQISNDIAKLPKAVFKKDGESRNKETDHPLNYLISTEPNEMMSSFDFWKVIVVLVIIKGNCYVKINRNETTGFEESLVILEDADMKVLVDKKRAKLAYIYKGNQINAKEILHFKAFSLDGINGISVIKFAAHNLGVNLDAQDYLSDIYSERGLSYGVIESDLNVKNEAKQLISAGFTEKMMSGNKFHVPVLDEGMKYRSITVTPAEAQFLETNKYAVIEIARWLNVAPHKLKDLSNANYSNIQAQNIEHVQDSLLPWIMRIELECKRKLFGLECPELYIKFNEKVLLRGDLQARQSFYAAMVYAGVMTRNEVRALEEYNPIEGLDEPLTPVNMELLGFMIDKNKKELKDE